MCHKCDVLDEDQISSNMVRVENTVRWLDSVKPNWRRLVDWDKLDISSGTWCVAGQVFAEEARESGLYSGFDWLADNHESVWHDLRDEYAFGGNDEIYSEQMTEVWILWHGNNLN